MDLATVKPRKIYKEINVKIENIEIPCIYLLIRTYIDIDSDEIQPILVSDDLNAITQHVEKSYPTYTKYSTSNVWVERPKRSETMSDTDWNIIRYNYKYMQIINVKYLKKDENTEKYINNYD